MKKYITVIRTVVISLVVVSAFILLGRWAAAQQTLPVTEPGGEAISAEIMPSYISGDPIYQNIVPPDDNPPVPKINSQSAPDEQGPQAPQSIFSYFMVSGATLRGRSSVPGYTYPGKGCLYLTSGTLYDRILNTELHLPSRAIIKYLRVYYIDTNPASGVDGFLTRYTPGLDYTDLTVAQGPDAFSNGYGYTVSPEITETVDNENYAYTLIGLPDENNIANQICGLRIAYYPPVTSLLFVPNINR